MIRYTKKERCLPKVDTNGTEHWVEYIKVEDKGRAEEKLYQLENIEEELGIDLVTLIEAMKNGVYVISYDEGIVFEEPMLGFNQESKTNLYVLDSVCHLPPDELCKSSNYYLKDYGKTWALTKEELQ